MSFLLHIYSHLVCIFPDKFYLPCWFWREKQKHKRKLPHLIKNLAYFFF